MAGNDIEQYVLQLINPQTRENALLELSKKRENFPELAPYLWYSFGTIAALLQEIVAIYPLLSPPSLTAHASNRVCNALALLQCVASHPETRGLFLQGAAGHVAACEGSPPASSGRQPCIEAHASVHRRRRWTPAAASRAHSGAAHLLLQRMCRCSCTHS
jgi:hypothetical protein